MPTTTQAEPEQEQVTSPSSAVNGQGAPEAEATAEEQPRKKRGRQPSAVKKTRTIELTLTVTGTAEGEWQADLVQSGKRVVQGLAISAAAVSRAATELHADIAKAIDTVLDQARQQHREKMEELEAELAKVRQALAELQEG